MKWLSEEILGDRVRLRAACTGDEDVLIGLRTDPVVREYLGGPLGEDIARERVRSEVGAWGCFAVLCRGSEEISGCVSFRASRGVWEISYVLDARSWGAGFGREAVLLACEWFCRERPVDRFIAVTQCVNDRSRRLLEGLGAVEVRRFVVFGEMQVEYEIPWFRVEGYSRNAVELGAVADHATPLRPGG